MSTSTRALASLASFSSERASRSASPRIWRSRSAICARNSLMRGCWSSSVEDCSASCARSVTRCSDSRRISSELTISEYSIGPARFQRLADQPRLRFGVGLLRARRAELGVEFAELLVRQRRVVGADEQIGPGAKLLDLGLGLGDLPAQRLDLAGEPLAGVAGLILLRGLLQHDDSPRRSHWRRGPQARDPPTRIRSRSRATSRPGRPTAARNSS